MSMALCVFLEDDAKNPSGMIDPNRAGISYGFEIVRYLDALDTLGENLGCRSLSTYVNEDPELYEEALGEAEGMMDEATLDGLRLRLEAAKRQEPWYEPEEALDTIRRILDHLQSHPEFPDDDDNPELLLWDLQTVEGFLTRALKERRRFRFEII